MCVGVAVQLWDKLHVTWQKYWDLFTCVVRVVTQEEDHKHYGISQSFPLYTGSKINKYNTWQVQWRSKSVAIEYELRGNIIKKLYNILIYIYWSACTDEWISKASVRFESFMLVGKNARTGRINIGQRQHEPHLLTRSLSQHKNLTVQLVLLLPLQPHSR